MRWVFLANDNRFGRVLEVLVTAFVLFGAYEGLKSHDVLKTTASYWIVGATFLYTIGIVGFVLFVQHRKRRKTQRELDYLLNLQQQFHLPPDGDN